MEFEILPKQTAIPDYDRDTMAVKLIEYFSGFDRYEGDEITPAVLAEVMEDIRTGAGELCFYAGPDEESDRMEAVFDGEWLALTCCFDLETYYCCYNLEFADTADLLDDADFCDEAVYTGMESGGQSPIPKIQAIRDMDAGIKAVEYFIHTGKIYPGIDWMKV